MSRRHKTALVTGASSGIGRALVENFARDGYDVILTARSASRMEAHASELRNQYGITATVISADLESNDGATKLHAEVKNRGIAISALANNAGYGTFGEFKDSDLNSQLGMMQINMGAVVALTRLFMPDLITLKGRILNVASTAAFQPGPYMAVYYATKAFVLSFSEALAEELEGTGVTVTALCPGPTTSGFQDKANMRDSMLVKDKKLPASQEVAALGYRAMERGQRVYIPGLMNWLIAQAPRFTPRRLVTRIVKAMSRPVSPE